jgi:putative redox protein
MANTLKVSLKSLNRDLTFAAKGQTGHFTMMDAKEEKGGNSAAGTPMELVLEALGGCTGLDVISILKKKRVSFSHLDINLDAERSDEHPKVFTSINIEFILYSNDGDKALTSLERAVELSHEKYCSVAAMLKPTVKMTIETKVIEE